MVVNAAGNLIALAEGSIAVSADSILGGSCGGPAYIELAPTGQQLFATYLPGGRQIGFDGADAQGTPYLDTPSGRVQIVKDQPTPPSVGCLVDPPSLSNSHAISPGAIVTIFGSGMGPSQGIGFQLVNGQVPVSTKRHAGFRKRGACPYFVLILRATDSGPPVFAGSRIETHDSSCQQWNTTQPAIECIGPIPGNIHFPDKWFGRGVESRLYGQLAAEPGASRFDCDAVWHGKGKRPTKYGWRSNATAVASSRERPASINSRCSSTWNHSWAYIPQRGVCRGRAFFGLGSHANQCDAAGFHSDGDRVSAGIASLSRDSCTTLFGRRDNIRIEQLNGRGLKRDAASTTVLYTLLQRVGRDSRNRTDYSVVASPAFTDSFAGLRAQPECWGRSS